MDRGQIPSGGQQPGAGSAQRDRRDVPWPRGGEGGLGGSGQSTCRGAWGANPETQVMKVLPGKVSDLWGPFEKLLNTPTSVPVPISTVVPLPPCF